MLPVGRSATVCKEPLSIFGHTAGPATWGGGADAGIVRNTRHLRESCMNDVAATKRVVTRELALHALYEAAELEHNLMCTYLYAAFSLKDGVAEGLAPDEAEAVSRWRQKLIRVAVEEMQHLAAVWNITSALGGSPRFGRTNFPLDPGYLPAIHPDAMEVERVVEVAHACPSGAIQ